MVNELGVTIPKCNVSVFSFKIVYQWEIQDLKMEVLYHRHRLCGDSPKNLGPPMVGAGPGGGDPMEAWMILRVWKRNFDRELQLTETLT